MSPSATSRRRFSAAPLRARSASRRPAASASISGAAANSCWPRPRPRPTSPTSCRAAATHSMEEAARVAPNNIWFQTVCREGRQPSPTRWSAAPATTGSGALVLTVDVPVHTKRERNMRNGFANVRNGGVLEAVQKLKPSILIEALTHPVWVYRLCQERRRADPRQLGAACGERREQGRGHQVRPHPDPSRGADLARPRTLSPPLSAHADRQGHPQSGRCRARRRDRLRRGHRVEPWRAPARSGAGLARRAAGSEGGGRRQA